MTLKFDGWPWKKIAHLFCATSSFVYHFVPIGELELQSGNAQFRRFLKPCDLEKQQGTFPMLLQALCIISQPSVNSNWSYSPKTPNLGQIRQFLKPCDLEIWQMVLQNNRAPLLCYFKLCAAFQSHQWIQTGGQATPHLGQNRQFFHRVTLQFDVWPWKTIGHLLHATSSFVHHFRTVWPCY